MAYKVMLYIPFLQLLCSNIFVCHVREDVDVTWLDHFLFHNFSLWNNTYKGSQLQGTCREHKQFTIEVM